MVKISQQSFCYKTCFRYVKLTSPKVILRKKSQVKQKQKVIFYANKYKDVELT